MNIHNVTQLLFYTFSCLNLVLQYKIQATSSVNGRTLHQCDSQRTEYCGRSSLTNMKDQQYFLNMFVCVGEFVTNNL